MRNIRCAALLVAALGSLLWTVASASAQPAGAPAPAQAAGAPAPAQPATVPADACSLLTDDMIKQISQKPSAFETSRSAWVTRGDSASVTFLDKRIDATQSVANICVKAYVKNDPNQKIELQRVLLETSSDPNDKRKDIKVVFNDYPPSGSLFFDSVQYTFIGIITGQNGQNSPLGFSYSTNLIVLTSLTTTILTWLFVLIAYGLLIGVTYPSDVNAVDKKARVFYVLSPVRVSAGPFGEASMSQVQVILFTVIVASLLFQVWLRTGALSGISTQLLYLLGISAVGAGGARFTESLKTGLSGPTARYLIAKGWYNWRVKPLRDHATFGRLFLTDGRLDVYKFQMAIFTIVVAFYVISAGQNDLSNVHISETILYLIGISQGVYVGGKAVTDRTADLEDATATMIDLEKQLRNPANSDPAKAADLQTQYRKAALRAANEYGPLTHREIGTNEDGTADAHYLEPAGIIVNTN